MINLYNMHKNKQSNSQTNKATNKATMQETNKQNNKAINKSVIEQETFVVSCFSLPSNRCYALKSLIWLDIFNS